MLKKIKNIKNTVKTLLKKNKKLRDSDDKLQVRIWLKQLNDSGLSISDISLAEFFVLYQAGEAVNPESIRRARQLVQEQNSSLRGNNYKAKQEEAEVVRLGIGEV